eukprot:3490573-Rhodomonas_salina.2
MPTKRSGLAAVVLQVPCLTCAMHLGTLFDLRDASNLTWNSARSDPELRPKLVLNLSSRRIARAWDSI